MSIKQYLISIEIPGRGALTVGQMVSSSKELAQERLFKMLVQTGFKEHEIVREVSGKHLSLHIGTATILIAEIPHIRDAVLSIKSLLKN